MQAELVDDEVWLAARSAQGLSSVAVVCSAVAIVDEGWLPRAQRSAVICCCGAQRSGCC